MSLGNISTAVFHDPSKRSSLKWRKGKNKLLRGLREVEPQKTFSQEKEKKHALADAGEYMCGLCFNGGPGSTWFLWCFGQIANCKLGCPDVIF
jgi:hypothetical protein